LKRHEQSEHVLSEKLSPGASEDAVASGAPVSGGGTASASQRRNGHQEILFTALDRVVLDRLRDADLDNLKPLDALNLLADLKKQIS
jgi:hypothetical protein